MSPPTIVSCSNRGASAGRKNLRVLLRCTRDTLRIPDELAAEIGAEEAFFVSPVGNGRVRPVEVGRDGDGAFLGHGWPEFAVACGVSAGWLLVLRHHGGGVLTVKAFDVSRCLRELAARPPADPMADASRRPQFISMLAPNAMEKLPIPANFVQNYISKGHMNSHITILIGPLGKICQAELKMNGPDTFLAGGWSEFLALHGITEDDCLLLRYEGSMTFTVKVFGPNGCQIESKHNGVRTQQISTLLDIEKQQELPSSFQKCKRKKDRLCSEERKKPKASMTSLNKVPLQKKSFYGIGPPSWIKKVINTSTLQKHLSLPLTFCAALGLREPCTITLKTSVSSTTSWKARVMPYNNCNHLGGLGWKRFCHENRIKEGDICTFNVVETKLWHVVIAHQ